MTRPSFALAVASLEAELSLPSGFVARLIQLDDWAFVVQSHALLETLVTECGIEHLRPEVRRSFSKIPISTKMRFIDDLKLLDKGGLNFIDGFSTLRNDFVHHVKQTHTTLHQHFAGQADPALLHASWRVSQPNWPGDPEVPSITLQYRTSFASDTRRALAVAVGSVAVELHERLVVERVRKTPANQVRLRDALLNGWMVAVTAQMSHEADIVRTNAAQKRAATDLLQTEPQAVLPPPDQEKK